jgi:hypothetical protein
LGTRLITPHLKNYFVTKWYTGLFGFLITYSILWGLPSTVDRYRAGGEISSSWNVMFENS